MAAPGRRQARERALELLYEAEAKDAEPVEIIDGLPVAPHGYTVALVTGVAQSRPELDEVIARYARGWTLERMPAVDRNLLRLACFELAHRPDVPTAVVIDEAVELAKQFSTEESGRFVNGMLSRIAAEVRGDGDTAP